MNGAAGRHAAKRAALAAQFQAGGGPVRLDKDSSNLFRDRGRDARRRLDLRAFCEVLKVDRGVDRETGCVESEGMASYEALTDACLAHGMMPAVVPQLKTITLGGAVAGVGIEATSHRHGLVHDTVSELDVLTAGGEIVSCTRDNANADLFHGFPNSYGTLGYAVRIKARAVPVTPFVHVEHRPHTDPHSFFADLEAHCRDSDADFIDGTVFEPGRLYLSLGRFVERVPSTSDYTYEQIYYRSIPQRREDWLTTRDYIWRWDTDWFWCSKNLYAQNPLIRRLYGRKRLNSRTYTRIMRWNTRVGLTRRLEGALGLHSESVIQDADIPIERAAEFLEFFAREIRIWPTWICPIGPQAGRIALREEALRSTSLREEAPRFPLYALQPKLYVNFGFWDVLRTRESHAPGHFNRLIEEKVLELGGIKSLYSDSYFSRETFDRTYGGEAYRQLKAKYDPTGVFPDLYAKCVLKG